MKQNALFPCLTNLIKHYSNASPSLYTINPYASQNETDIDMPHQIKIEFLLPHQIDNDILCQIISKQLNNYFGMALVQSKKLQPTTPSTHNHL